MTRATKISAGFLAILSSASLALSSEAAAEDLGVHGKLFPIAEPDMIEAIYTRLRTMDAAGEIDRINRNFAERAQARVRRPEPVPGLAATDKERSWLFDPSITLSEDITDHHGTILGRKGTRINPLDHQPFAQTLLFINGDDEPQVTWALTQAEASKPAQIILTAGAPIDLMKEHKTPLFFDQGGYLVGRFGIRQTPALVRQEGDALRISEVRP